jgi:protein-tyrosine kinase
MANVEKGLARARGATEPLRPVPLAGASALDFDRLERVALDPRVLSRNRIVMDELSAASAAYKMLRTRMLQRMRLNGWQTVAVTGTCPDEGKSLTAINLSISLARDLGTTVVLVDMDLRKPSLYRQLGFSPRNGLSDYLRGSVPLDKVAVRLAGIDRLAVIANERRFPSSSELLTSPQTTRLIEQCKQGEGRIVVFDLPPVLASDDMLAFCPLVDAVLLVLSQGKTKHADMLAARDLLQHVNLLGAVLNRSSEDIAPYYYYA